MSQAEKRFGIGGPPWTSHSTTATSAITSGLPTSERSSVRPGMNAVTRHSGSRRKATTSGPMPAAAAAAVALRSQSRSIPSSPVSLPAIRTTRSRPP